MNASSEFRAPLLDLDLLRTLVAIADTGNFSAAAARVFRTPSAVSMQVKKIEETLGRPVFNRTSRSVSLTADGEVVLEHARRLLALNHDLLARYVQPDVAGQVRLGAPDDVAERHLPPMLRRFAETHPCVSVAVVVEGTARMIEMVRDHRLDMAIVTQNTTDTGPPRGGDTLLREPLVWAMLKGGVAGERNPLPLSVWEDTCVWRRAAEKCLKEVGRDYSIAFESAHISGQKAAILADLVVAPIPRSSLSDNIVEAPAALGLPPLPEYALALCVREDPPAAVQAAADHMRASFAKCS